MRNGYNVVCNTAAGRNRYMKLLIPYVLSCDIVDRYDLWVNTMNKEDLVFFELLAIKYPVINLMYIDDNTYKGIGSIFGFYKKSIDSNTVYVKLDDDLIWMEPDAITKMVDFRIANPEYFIVSPLVINNASGAYILQNGGKIKIKKYLSPSMWPSGWCNGKSAYNLLKWFLNRIKNDEYLDLHMGQKPIAMQRFSINMICWFGEDMQKFNGNMLYDDEEELSVIKPVFFGKCNCINSDVIVVHFAFNEQRKFLDKTDILESYEELFEKKLLNSIIVDFYFEIKKLLKETRDNQVNIPNYHKFKPKRSLIERIKIYICKKNIPFTKIKIQRIFRSLKSADFNFE